MKTLWCSFVLATSMYSKLPTPKTEWSDRSMAYVFCFFPWIGLVIGGGNFWRGRSSENIDRTKADQIGMLATVMNALALSDVFEQNGVDARVMTAVPMTV